MPDFLNRFDKRMEFAAVSDSIMNRKNRNSELEQRFEECEMDNLLLSVLVFIMERTLSEEHDCTIGSVSSFLTEILPAYGKHFSPAETDELARYLVKDILQNKGMRRNYKVMDYGKSSFREITIRLITDHSNEKNQIVYELTRQGYDFLFRTKEVDDQLGFRLEEIRLQVQIERHYYREAIGQSRELVQMLLQKQHEMKQFGRDIRGDLSQVSGESYDRLVTGMNAVLKEEYGMMQTVERKAGLALKQLDEEERQRGNLNEKAREASSDVRGILKNVRRALSLQRRLLILGEKIGKLYLDVLQDAVSYQSIHRFGLDDEILVPLEKYKTADPEELRHLCTGLLVPLCLPEFPRFLNLDLIYDRQAKIQESEHEQAAMEEETEEDLAERRIQWRSWLHVRVIDRLLAYASENPVGFTLEQFCEDLRRSDELLQLCRERILLLDMLRLYEFQTIDLRQWKQQQTEWVMQSVGEFDLSYCLGKIMGVHPDFYGVRQIRLERSGTTFICSLPAVKAADGLTETVELETDNLQFEVVKDAAGTSDSSNPS
jgi:hypothetical protein